jgi:hypothetical protein
MKNNSIYINDTFIPYENINIQRDIVYFLIRKEYLEKCVSLQSNKILFQHGFTVKDTGGSTIIPQQERHWWEIVNLDSMIYSEDVYARPGLFELSISGKRELIDIKSLQRDYFIDKILDI